MRLDNNKEVAHSLDAGIDTINESSLSFQDISLFEKELSNETLGSVGRRAIPGVIVLSLLTLLIGKLGVEASDPIYFYGIAVTAVPLLSFLLVFILYRDPALNANNKVISSAAGPLVSCLVAVHNEEKIIEQCISSFVNSTYPNKEIIFVNDASTDSTALILDTYQATGLIKAIHLEKNIGKKRALAKGIMLSKGSIIVFSDSDSIIAPDAVSKVVDVFQSDELIGAVSGHCRALNADSNLITRIQDSWYEGQFAIRKAFESIFGCVTCVSGPLAAFRREAIFNLIPAWEDDKFLGQEFKFATDRTLTGFVLGSLSIGNKLKKKYAHSPFVKAIDYPCRDWKVVYCKSAKALTEVPDTFQRLLKQQIRWKKSFIRNIFFTGYFYWKKPLLPAFAYYIHILFVLMGPFIAFRHLVYLPMHGNLLSLFLYVGGVFFIGSMFGLAYKFENRESKQWIYRPLMSLLSTFILSWLIFYSLATIRKMVWSRA